MVPAVSNTVKDPCLCALIEFRFYSLCPLPRSLLGPSTLQVFSFQPAQSHGIGDCVQRGRKGTSFGWTGGSKVRRMEPVKVGKWEQGMKFGGEP